MRLYRIARVEEIEASPDFGQARERIEVRRQGGRQAAETRRQALLTRVATLDIDVANYALDVLFERARTHFNDRQFEREHLDGFERDLASPSSDEAFQHRIAVNYLRHVGTAYENWLNEFQRLPGVAEARLAIKRRVLDEIARVYPALAAECQRQFERAQQRYQERMGCR